MTVRETKWKFKVNVKIPWHKTCTKVEGPLYSTFFRWHFAYTQEDCILQPHWNFTKENIPGISLCQFLSRNWALFYESFWCFFANNNKYLLVLYYKNSFSITILKRAFYVMNFWHTFMSFSLISHEKMPGFCLFSSSILASTSGVATLGFEPPITPGRIDPVS